MKYGISTQSTLAFSEAVEKTKQALQSAGFGILTEIDVSATLKKKLDVDYPDYVILGACQPEYAYKALSAEAEIGLLLPCNVIVYTDRNGTTTISAIRPSAAMSIIDNPDVAGVAVEIEAKLEKVITDIG